jgi:glutaredoxin
MAAPAARLFTSPGCPHCNGVKRSLEQLLQQGIITELEIVDISQQPERARELGVRSVPWLEMGELILSGEQSLSELRQWATRLAAPDALVDYYASLLADGELAVAESMLQKNPVTLSALLLLLIRKDLPLQVRIGTMALFEGFAGRVQLQQLVPELSAHSGHSDYRIRADIAYLLGLSGTQQALSPLQSLLKDENPEVREIAQEAVEELQAS